MRGNRGGRSRSQGRRGSIPARAGEPRVESGSKLPKRVYPRTCGGTGARSCIRARSRGLSPHVRGNRSTVRAPDLVVGSIPARAGEPSERDERLETLKVYPRTCGGTDAKTSAADRINGLSPHVRGNPSPLPLERPAPGSIPARAGEPAQGRSALGLDAVYPRTCGGTLSRVFLSPRYTGLSPHVRGNREVPRTGVPSRRSIPARAGEPLCAAARL